MRDIGPRIARRHHLRVSAAARRIAQHTIVRRLTDQPRRLLLVGRDLPHVVPLRVQRRGRGGALHDGFVVADERDEIADAHDAEIAAFRAPQRGLVQRRKTRAATRLAQDARVQHVRPHHVMDEGRAR